MRWSTAGALALALSTPAISQTDPAQVPVRALDSALISIMKSKAADRMRAQALAPIIDRAFDLPLMTRLSVGPNWTSISPGDQQALVAAFRRLIIAQYASNFDSWSGENFTIAPNVESRGGDKLVRTTLNAPGEEPIKISYRLRANGGEWKIIDVFYRNAISQIATRRSDFAAVLAKEGATGLVAHLDRLAVKGSF